MKIGVTIMGGGMCSVAYAGALQAFNEANVKPVVLVGSSGGAVVSACYAFGVNPVDILNHFRTFNMYSLFNPFFILKHRKLNYGSWVNHAAKLVPIDRTIQESAIKLAIHATSFDSQDSVFFREGNAVEAVVASSAIFSSYNYLGKNYYDGDYDPETAATVLTEMGAEYKILLSIANQETQPSIFPFYITQKNALKADLQIHPVDLVCEIPVKGDSFNKTYLDHNYTQGYLVMRNLLAKKLQSVR